MDRVKVTARSIGNKDLRALVRSLVRDGWELGRLNTGHFIITKGDMLVKFAGTPSDGNVVHVVRRLVRKAESGEHQQLGNRRTS